MVRVAPGIFYALQQIEDLKAELSSTFDHKQFSAAQFRDAVGTTRKYAIPLLEYFDSLRFTTRTGDMRAVNDR